MLIELYMFYEFILIGFFLIAFWRKNEILWAITIILAGILMFSSYDVQITAYQLNNTINAYSPVILTQHYIYLGWINGIFFAISLLLMLFDIFDKYGMKFLDKGEDREE